MVHGFQLLDIWLHHSAWNDANCERSKLFDTSATGKSHIIFYIFIHIFYHILWMYTCLEFLFTIFMMVSKCRFVVGMERQSYSEFGFCPGHGNFVNGSWSLRAYLVAPWHGIPFCGCDPFSKHTCKYLCKYFILHLFNHRKIFMCLLLHIIFFLLMRFIIEIWAGLAKCNYKTHKRVHETEKSIGCSPCSPSRCNI